MQSMLKVLQLIQYELLNIYIIKFNKKNYTTIIHIQFIKINPYFSQIDILRKKFFV